MFSKTYFLSSIKFIPIDRWLFYYKNKLCLKNEGYAIRSILVVFCDIL